MAPTALLPALVVPLILFGLYRRLRRTFGRQPIQRKRMMVRIGLMCVALFFIVAPALHSTDLLLSAVGGAVIGAALGVLGLRLTRFEITPDGQEFYTPNVYIGAALTLIVVGRLIYRFTMMGPVLMQSASAAPPADPFSAVHSSPLTLGIITVLIGYYLIYFIGILREGKKHGVA
jgi:hypothetical protein